LIYTVALIASSLCPFLLQLSGPFYLASALTLGGVFLWFAVLFARELTISRARQLFYVSILYLPMLLGMMVLDKVN
jgi:protoheme IX farnesyltransferase